MAALLPASCFSDCRLCVLYCLTMKTYSVSISVAAALQYTATAFTAAPAFSRLTTLSHSPRPSWTSLHNTATNGCEFDFALIFDCDGVIIETEELHRLAYNAAFKAANLSIDGEPVDWSVEYYDVLQNTVGGGKGKMFYHFRNTAFPMSGNKPAPSTPQEEEALVDALQSHKTELYKEMVEKKAVPRPGVIELMDEALADPKIAVGVCSASTKEAVMKVLDVTLGPDRREKLNVVILGNDVAKLKPDPMIYNTAAERLRIDCNKCVVIEDSMIGLQAAKGAGMKCIITYTSSTESEDFYGQGADAKIPDLGSRKVTLASIFNPLKENDKDAEFLVGIKDPVEMNSAT